MILTIQHLIITVLLFAGMLLYFKLADRYNIIDKPNERSSHNYITIRGGGIVFWLVGVLYALMTWPDSLCFLFGITLICGVSLWDDIVSLPNKVRLIVHFLSISIVFYGLCVFTILPWWGTLLAYVFFVGVLNGYNFMDGINGITGLYSLSVFISLYYINEHIFAFTDTDFILYPILACVVFLFFNYRKRARCFAGDIGSMGIAFWIVTLLVQLIITTRSFVWVLLLAVYGVDTICTILHRLYLKQNIFEAHRLHFYQILSNECRMDHRVVSAIYAIVQLIVSFCFIKLYGKVDIYLLGCLLIIPLLLIYIYKFVLIQPPKGT